MSPLLEVRGLRSGYSGGVVVDGVDLDVAEGEVVALLGRNGVGKTTLLQTIMGLVEPSAGSVRVGGTELTRRGATAVARAGVGYVPQGRRVFGPLTVEENLRVAVRVESRGPWTLAAVYELLPRLRERERHRGNQLSGGEQQMLAIGRALLGNPRLLLMDEPSDGLAPALVRQVTGVISDLAARGLAVLLVEQDLRAAFTVSGRVVVMEKGRLVHSAATDDFRRDPDTARRLLGVG